MMTKFTYTSKIHLNLSINYQWKRRNRIKELKHPEAFIDYSNDMKT